MKLSKLNQNIVLKRKASCLVERDRESYWRARQWRLASCKGEGEGVFREWQVYLDFDQYPKEKD